MKTLTKKEKAENKLLSEIIKKSVTGLVSFEILRDEKSYYNPISKVCINYTDGYFDTDILSQLVLFVENTFDNLGIDIGDYSINTTMSCEIDSLIFIFSYNS